MLERVNKSNLFSFKAFLVTCVEIQTKMMIMVAFTNFFKTRILGPRECAIFTPFNLSLSLNYSSKVVINRDI